MRRKIIISLVTLLSVPFLGACGSSDDIQHAVAIVTTSSGKYMSTSDSTDVNKARENMVLVVNNEEEQVKLYFVCPKCGHEENWESSTTKLEAKLFTCECDGSNDIIGKPEYFCIATANGEEFFGIKNEAEE